MLVFLVSVSFRWHTIDYGDGWRWLYAVYVRVRLLFTLVKYLLSPKCAVPRLQSRSPSLHVFQYFYSLPSGCDALAK